MYCLACNVGWTLDKFSDCLFLQHSFAFFLDLVLELVRTMAGSISSHYIWCSFDTHTIVFFFHFQPQNRRFQYSLSGEDSRYFTIDPSSGLLTVNASLDYEQRKFNFSFKVIRASAMLNQNVLIIIIIIVLNSSIVIAHVVTSYLQLSNSDHKKGCVISKSQ